jgi:hypothetical protein
MKIAASSVQLAATHTAIERHQRRESLTAWRDEPARRRPVPAISRAGQEALATAAQAKRGASVAEPSAEAIATDDPKLTIMLLLIEKMTGRRIKLFRPEQVDRPCECAQPAVEPAETVESAPRNERLGWGMVHESHESHHEVEKTAFAASGLIRTADGQEIEFGAELTMSREFFSETSLTLRAGDALKDPLVINFNGTAARLTQTRFAFDIDLDGQPDQINFLREGSGFLALDRNGDGEINDGGELFGPRSGDGFAELAAFDQDENLWIDENDSIYERLRIWSRDEAGTNQLLALGQSGVGAIYLGQIATPFELKDSANESQGAVRSTGIYLNEDGTPGTIQQIDLVV